MKSVKSQTFVQGSVVLIASALLVKVVGAMFKVPLANVLGGEGMGYFGCGYSLFLPVYAVTVNGLSPAVSKLTAERVSNHDYASVERVKRTSLVAFGVVGLVGSVLMVLLSRVFCTYVADSPDAYLCVAALAPSVLFGSLCAVYRGYYEGLCNMVPTALSQLVEAVGKLVLGLGLCCLAVRHYDALSRYFPGVDAYALGSAGAVLGVSLSTGVGLLVVLAFEPFRSVPKVRTVATRPERRTVLRELLSVMVPIAVGSLVTNLTTLIDLATVPRYVGRLPAESILSKYGVSTDSPAAFVYGSYTGLAVTVFNLVPSVTNTLSKGALPNVVRSWKTHDLGSLRRDVSDVLSMALLLAVPSGMGLTFLARPILTFLYPMRADEVAVSYESLSCMGLGVVCLCLSYPLFSVLQGIDRADVPIKVTLVGVAVKLLGNVVLLSTPSTAVYGAGVSTSVCYLVVFVLTFVAYTRVSGVRVNLLKASLPILYGSTLCTVAAVVCYDVLSRYRSCRVSLVVSILVGGAVYVSTLYLMGVEPYTGGRRPDAVTKTPTPE